MPSKRNRTKGKASRSSTPTPQSRSSSPTPNSNSNNSSSIKSSSNNHRLNKSPKSTVEPVLTSDERRGVFECDYCHADISRVPRIRCAVCPEFDLCLDCFSTSSRNSTSSTSAKNSSSGSAAATSASTSQQTGASSLGGTSGAPGSSTAGAASNSGGSSGSQSKYHPQHHDHTHGYRVADSTRYPMFPKSTALRDISDTMSHDGMSNDGEQQQQPNDTASAGLGGDESQVKKKKIKGDGHAAAAETVPDQSSADTATATATPSTPRATDITNDGKQDTGSKDDSDYILIQDDPKHSWTAEEDLRLLDAIKTCGLGNWADISEAVSGPGSSHKTARRCMERYFDDFLGRYGHILPAYIIDDVEDDTSAATAALDDSSTPDVPTNPEVMERTSSSKRMRVSTFGAPSNSTSSKRQRRVKVAPTASLPGYDSLWPKPYLPPIAKAQMGQDVGRDVCFRAEQAFVKLMGNASSKEEADAIRKEWKETRLNQPGGPTALPMRLDDLPTLPGSELAGFMPRRGDLDVEHQNDAEDVIADMEFSANDSPQDRELKVQIIQIYNSKLDERERRKNYLLSRGLFDYRKNQVADSKLPRDEKDLIRRMRIFERLHTPEEHKVFMEGILKAKRLRKEIAKLQMYRRLGITTLVEAEKYELDKNRREFHKMSQLQKESERVKAAEAASQKDSSGGDGVMGDDDISSSLWKQYRTSDRKNRRSVNRTNPGVITAATTAGTAALDKTHGTAKTDQKSSSSAMNVEEIPGKAKEESASKAGKDNSKKEGASIATVPTQGQQQDGKTSDTAVSTNNGAPDGSKATFEISRMAGYELLSKKEVKLCSDLEIKPSQYIRAKKAIIAESFRHDWLDIGTTKRTVIKIDVEKKGEVIDFIVKAGWIPNKVGDSLNQ